MAYSRRSYKGAAVANAIASGTLAAGGTSINLASAMSGWDTSGTPFFVVIDPGTAKEEKVCVKYNTSTNLTVVDPAVTSGWTASANGRGCDDTQDRQHDAGAVIYPVFTATEANQANELVSKYTTNGDIVVHGSAGIKTLSTGGSGTNGQALIADSTVTNGGVKWAQVDTGGIANAAVTADKIATAVAGSGLAGGAGTALSVNVDASTIEINSDTLRVKDGGITSAKIADGAIVNADINDSAAIALSKLATGSLPSAITIASANVVNGSLLTTDFDTSTAVASGGVPVVTVSSSSATGGKDGDVWIVV